MQVLQLCCLWQSSIRWNISLNYVPFISEGFTKQNRQKTFSQLVSLSLLTRKKEEDIKEQHIPTLEMLTLAEKHDLNDLVDGMLVKCAAKLSLSQIDRQKKLPENKDLSDSNYLKLIR